MLGGEDVALWSGNTNGCDYPCVMRFENNDRLLVVRECGYLMEFEGQKKIRSMRIGVRSAIDYRSRGNQWMAVGLAGIVHGLGLNRKSIWDKKLADGCVSKDANLAATVLNERGGNTIEEFSWGMVFPNGNSYAGSEKLTFPACYGHRNTKYNRENKPYLIYEEEGEICILDIREKKVIWKAECPEMMGFTESDLLDWIIAVNSSELLVWKGITPK